MNKAAIIYWSGTGNTETMAEAIKAGVAEQGGEAELFPVSDAASVDFGAYDCLAFGCPAMGDEVLEEDEFEPYFTSAEDKLSGKKVALFGSYDWGDGEWMRTWADRAKGKGANLMDDGLIMQLEPEEDGCKEFGKKLAQF